MLKLAIFACLCAALLVKGQDVPPPPPPPDGVPPPQKMEHHRVARQAMPMPQAMPAMPGMGGDSPGNLGMQGLGNFPDPTAVLAKFQEVGRQFLGGRRRRQAPPIPTPPSF